MTLQLLDNLTGLQIPDVYTMILTATHDPLATCDGEAAKDTIRVVLVSCIGLETLSSMIVPKTNCIIQGRCQNELSVGRELYERARVLIKK